ncbi:MAG: DUF1232 domain-containing protein [Bacillaceae bacterium]|nr:DUF1232 domain-containing protein [Bacillaceae bacterium]
MKTLKRLRFILTFKKSLPFLKDFFLSGEVKLLKKAISILLLVGYIVLPFDAIPDFFAVIGLVDDLTVLTLILNQIVKMAPDSLKEKYHLE